MKISKIIYWLPRILGLVFVLFLSVFSFDVFEEYSGWNAVLLLLIHSVPSLVLLIVIFAAWKRDLIGAIVFLVAAIAYIFSVGFDRPWSWYVAISGPAALVGILFIFSWLQGRKEVK